MLVLAIWLFLIGYSVTIAGKRNLGLQYTPQSDGAIKAVDAQGNPARTYSLMDVITCAGPSGQLQGQPGAPASSRPPSVPATPATRPEPATRLQLQPAAVPALAPSLRLPPGINLPRPPTALPPLVPPEIADELGKLDRSISGAVYDGLTGLINTVKRIQVPNLRPTPAPGLGPRPGLVP